MSEEEKRPLVASKASARKSNASNNASQSKKAKTIPVALRWATNVLSLLSALLFSGIIFGWAPLELMLAREGQYGEVCGRSGGDGDSNGDGANGGAVGGGAGGSAGENDDVEQQPGSGGVSVCPEQIIKLQVIFTVAQFLLSFLSLPVGWVVDHASKVLYYGFTAIVEIAGLLLFSMSDSVEFDHFTLGYGLMAAGGCLTMLGAFPASFLVPERQPMVLASISCLFDASSAVFFAFHRLAESYPDTWTRRTLFAALACAGVAVYASLAACWLMLERVGWRETLDREQEESHRRGGAQQGHDQQSYDDDDGEGGDDNNNGGHPLPTTALHKQPLLSQLATPEFALAVAFASSHMLRCNYYIMTVDDFLRYLGDTPGGLYANIFSAVLPCGVVFVPLIECTVTRLGVQRTLHLTNALGVAFGALLFVPILNVQVVAFAVFACFRAYLYATVNTFIAFHFGVETMGRVIGCTFTTAAVVSLLQYPAAVYSAAGHWTGTNVVMLAACAVPVALAAAYRETPAHPLHPAAKSPILSSPLMHSTRRILRSDLESGDAQPASPPF